MEFQLLGEMEAWHEGRRIVLGGHRQRCVLAVLLLEAGRVVPVERIVAHAWPADPPETAPNLVTSYISRLRRLFTPAAGQIDLVSRRPGYLAQIDPDRIDAHRFTHLVHQARRDREGMEPEGAAASLRRALELWDGIALADLDSAWLGEQRHRLEQARLDAVELLAEIELEADHANLIITLVRDLAEAHPERERLTVLAIRALCAVGEPSQAVDLASRAIRSLRSQGLDPGPVLRQAQLEALRPSNRTVQPRTGTARAQLPADTPTFTGRAPELEELTALVADGRVTEDVVVCTVDGMAGIGKTAFAVHAAHQLAAHFPDGQLFIDLHGYTPGMEPTKPTTALSRILRALGVAPQHIPPDPDERAALYRDRLGATRTLIVLDNAASETQIRPLLPGAPGCLLLVTGRRRLNGLDDAHNIRIEGLPDADATALFTLVAGPGRVSGGDPALAQTVALCGNIPLAIRIAAARLRNRPAWPLRYLAVRLRDHAQRLTQLDDGERSLAAALTDSYNHLPTAERRMFRRLGLHPGSHLDAYAATALADTPLETADSLLEALVDHNLLLQPTTGRYQLHDLVRIYARDLAESESPDQCSRALDRLANYYLYAARTADHLLAYRTTNHTAPLAAVPAAAPKLTTDTQAAAWMETERSNLTSMVNHAAKHGLAAYAMALPIAMHGSLRIHGHWALSQDLQRIALATAQRANDSRGQAHALCCLGDIQTLTGHYPQAADAFTSALKAYRELGDRLGQANAYSGLAQVHRLTAHLAQAVHTLQHALDIYHGLGDWLGQANALTTLGGVHKLTGRYPESEDALEQALDLYTHFEHRLGQAQALTDLGEVQQLTGEYARAQDTLRRALRLYQELGNRLGQAVALTCLGEVQQLTGEYADALDTLRQALELSQQLGNHLNKAEALTTLGTVQHAMQQHAQAYETLQHAVRLCRQLDHRLGQANALTVVADVERAMGRYQEAAETHRRALELYRQIEQDL